MVCIGLLLIYSADHALHNTDHFERQLMAAVIGSVLVALMAVLPPRFFYATAYLAYGAGLMFILLVLVLGEVGFGARRWLEVGGVRFQPSEPAKLAFILAVGRYLSDLRLPTIGWNVVGRVGLLTLPFFGLILIQPDLGTATVIPVIAAGMLAWYGLPFNYFIILGLPPLSLFLSVMPFIVVPVLIVGLIWLTRSGVKWVVVGLVAVVCLIGTISAPMAWNRLEPYQQQRLISFLNPEADPLGSGYQVIQSRVAIGSGGFTGTGFMEGTQTQLRFLPQQHTDFIFSIAGEEFGFLGSSVILFLYFCFGWRGFAVAGAARNQLLSLTAAGATIMVLYHMAVNIGMTIGHLPVTGLPLPFISYGGSFLLTCMMAAGFILIAGLHRRSY